MENNLLQDKKGVYNVAIVEDEALHTDLLVEMLNCYAKTRGVLFSIASFNSIESFFTGYKPFDLIFMDIELPGMNGMEGARRLRETDDVAVLIFITNMAQFAVCGYEVSAFDYIVKPLAYRSFSVKLDRAVAFLRNRADNHILVSNKDEVHNISLRDLLYVEVCGHKLVFHKINGEEVNTCGSLGKLAEELGGSGFSRCSSCYLLNMRYVSKVNGLTVELKDGTELQISRRKRKEFLDDFTIFIGSTGGR
ncbi:MAG: LytR/AlgR family response regulator transcription factor [Candidatus Coproplasma sp.]